MSGESSCASDGRSRCTATPSTTSTTPAASSGTGICASTSTPTTVAVAGSRETSSAYVPRLSRAMASWSQTYGITDEQMPTPTPAASSRGSVSAGTAWTKPMGSAAAEAMSIASARPSMPLRAGLREARWARTT